MERRLFEWLKRLFRQQERRYLDEIERQFNKARSDIPTALTERSEEEIRIFTEAAMAEYEVLLEDAAVLGLGVARLSLDLFDIENANAQIFLQQKVFNFATQVNKTTTEQLRQQLREAIREGEGILTIARRVRSVFDGTIRGTAERSRLIARTEMTSITSNGARIAYEQNQDIIEKMEWLSSRDNRVRPTHTAADGQQVDLGMSFEVGGVMMRCPGDTNAPARETVRCRCTVMPVLAD